MRWTSIDRNAQQCIWHWLAHTDTSSSTTHQNTTYCRTHLRSSHTMRSAIWIHINDSFNGSLPTPTGDGVDEGRTHPFRILLVSTSSSVVLISLSINKQSTSHNRQTDASVQDRQTNSCNEVQRRTDELDKIYPIRLSVGAHG